MNHVTHAFSSTDSSIFVPKNNTFCYTKKYRYRFHLDTQFLILLTFRESLRISFLNMVTILMVLAKMATPGLLTIKIFWKKVMTS